MPASFFSLGMPMPGSGHKSETDLREFGSATPFKTGAADDDMNGAIEEGDEYSDAHDGQQ